MASEWELTAAEGDAVNLSYQIYKEVKDAYPDQQADHRANKTGPAVVLFFVFVVSTCGHYLHLKRQDNLWASMQLSAVSIKAPLKS